MANQIPPPPPKKNQISQPDVMGQLQKQNAPKSVMPVQEIIKHDCETNGCPVSWQQIYAGLSEAVKSPKYRIMRANNSLLAFSIPQKGIAEAHVITADEPRTLVDSLKQFHQALKAAGYKQIRSKVTNPQMLRAIQMAGMNVKQSQDHHVDGGKATPAIGIVVEV